jgi:hypothetical protein
MLETYNVLNFNKEQIHIRYHLLTVYQFCNTGFRKCYMKGGSTFRRKHKPFYHYLYLYKRTIFLIFIAGH